MTELNDLWARNDRACLTRQDVNFFPTQGGDATEARTVCAECPAQEPCLAWALHHEHFGVWGGTSEHERRRMRRQLGVAVHAPQAATMQPAAVCGTEGGYHRHRDRKETICGPCRDAHNRGERRRRARRNGRAA